MKRKVLIGLLCLSMVFSFSACVEKKVTSASVEPTETEEVIAIDSEEIEPTEEVYTDTVNDEGLTADEAAQTDVDYMVDIIGTWDGEAWDEYAASQGADYLDAGWLIYEHGGAAGTEPSYAINVRTGEKKVAGPNTFLYGSSADDAGANQFFGTQNLLPGEEMCESQANFISYIESLD